MGKYSKYVVALLSLCLLTVSLFPQRVQASPTQTLASDMESSVIKLRQGNDSYFLSTASADILTGNTITLDIYGISEEEISYKSEDSSIASIESSSDSSCTIRGQAVGNTIITIKIKKKNRFFFMSSVTTLRCKINVTPLAASIRFKKKKYKLSVNQKKKLGITLRPSITKEVPIFTSSNRTVATVTVSGRVRTRSIGTATITATLQNGMTAKCKIVVTYKIKKVKKS